MTTEATPGKTGIYTLAKLRKGLVDFVIGRLVQAIVSFAVVVVLVRLLTIPDYGAYMVVQGLVRMMRRLGSFGLLQASQYFIPKAAAEVPSRARFGLIVSLIGARIATLVLIAVILSIAGDAIAKASGFSPEQARAASLAIFLVVSFQSMVFVTEALEALLEQRLAQLTNALQPIGRLALIGLFWAGGSEDFGIETVLWIDIAVSTLCTILALGFLFWRLKGLPSGTEVAPSMKEVLRFACHFAPVGILDVFLSAGALRMIVAHFLGLSEAALFAFLQQMAAFLSRFEPAVLLQRLVQPILISRLGEPGAIRLIRDSINILWKLDMMLIGAVIAVMGAIGEDVLAIISSGKFTAGVEVLIVLLLILVANVQKNLAVMAMQLVGQSARVWKISLLAPLGFLVASLVAGYGLGVMVVSVWIVSLMWSLVALRGIEAQHADLRLEWTSSFGLAAAVAIALGAGLVVANSLSGPLWPLVVSCAVTGAVYLACLAVFRPLNRSEYEILTQAVGPRMATPIGVLSRA